MIYFIELVIFNTKHEWKWAVQTNDNDNDANRLYDWTNEHTRRPLLSILYIRYTQYHMCYFYRVERILTESINLKYHWCWLPPSIFILLCFHRLDTLIWARLNASFISEEYYQIWFAVKIRACPNLYNLWSYGQVKNFKRNMKLTENKNATKSFD